MDTRFAITEYPNAAALTAQLDALIKNLSIQSTEPLLRSMNKNTSRRSALNLKK